MKLTRVHLLRATLRALVPTLALVYGQDVFAFDFTRLWSVTGDGTVIKEIRNVEQFQSVILNTGARVVIRQGKSDSVVVEAESNVLPLIEAYVDGGTLKVKDTRNFKSQSAEVVITVRRLNGIATTAMVAVTAEGLTSPSLSLSMGGSSVISLKALSVGKLRASLGGSSVLKINGIADEFFAELGGSAALRSTELAAKTVSVNGGGSAQAVVWATESMSVSLSGSAGLSYFGVDSPTVTTSGAAMVKRLGPAPPKLQ